MFRVSSLGLEFSRSFTSRIGITPRQCGRSLSCLSAGTVPARPFIYRTIPPKSSHLLTSGGSLNIQLRRLATQRPKQAEGIPPRSVGYWLLSCSALVFAIVVVGGITRLTESGLSITEWKPITGVAFPRTPEKWQEEFAKYSQSPEYKILNSTMTVEEFKKIYFMEWSHRVLGRVLGVAFVLPAGYFLFRGGIKGRDRLLTGLGAALIGFQGFLGWYMVRSGLEPPTSPEDPSIVPRVSQYRLAAHLGTAISLYAGMLWRGLGILSDHRTVLAKPSLSLPRGFRAATLFTTGLVFLTVMSGAFVAGLDAGLIYNEFPWMGDSLIPPTAEIFNFKPWWRNMFENPSLVQFDHRLLGTMTYSTVMALFLKSLRSQWREALPIATRRALYLTVLAANVQVLLGVSTLLYLVPVDLAASHQAGSVLLLTALLLLGVTMRRPRIVGGVLT